MIQPINAVNAPNVLLALKVVATDIAVNIGTKAISFLKNSFANVNEFLISTFNEGIFRKTESKTP